MNSAPFPRTAADIKAERAAVRRLVMRSTNRSNAVPVRERRSFDAVMAGLTEETYLGRVEALPVGSKT